MKEAFRVFYVPYVTLNNLVSLFLTHVAYFFYNISAPQFTFYFRKNVDVEMTINPQYSEQYFALK